MLCEGCTGGLYRRLHGKRRWGITHDNTVHVPSNATQGLYLSGWLSRLNSACPSIKICRAFKKFFSFAPMSNRFRMPTASIRYALYVNIIGWFFFWQMGLGCCNGESESVLARKKRHVHGVRKERHTSDHSAIRTNGASFPHAHPLHDSCWRDR